MNFIKITLFQLILLLNVSAIFAQNNVPILITGSIKNNGSPVGTEIRLVDESGASYKLKSNSMDGFYQQSLKSGMNYHIFIDGYLIDNGNNQINIPPSTEYREITFNFNVIKLDAGLEIFKSTGFEKNKAILTNEGNEYLKDLKELTKTQKSVIYFDIMINTSDNDFKVKKEKVTEIVQVKGKDKKKTKTITISIEEQRKKLFKEREAILIDKLAEFKINKRNINFIHDNSPMPKVAKPKKSKKNEINIQNIKLNNLIVKINKVNKL